MDGFKDGTFGGDKNMTVEQMLSVAAYTLIEEKGYEAPANVDAYLTSFADADEIGNWAKQQVALTVRDGLMDRGGELDPQSDITREQAALILYRLFLLLYEVSPVAMELPASGGFGGGAVAAVGGLAVVGAGAAFFLKKKKPVVK